MVERAPSARYNTAFPHAEGYRSGRNGVDSKSTWRCEPPRGFESHPLRHPPSLKIGNLQKGDFELRRMARCVARVITGFRWKLERSRAPFLRTPLIWVGFEREPAADEQEGPVESPSARASPYA